MQEVKQKHHQQNGSRVRTEGKCLKTEQEVEHSDSDKD